MTAVPTPSRRLRLETKVDEGAQQVVVRCCGRLTAEHAEQFKTEVRNLIPGARRLVLDFTQVEYMDSSGLGAVIRLYVSAKTADCELKLVNFNQRVRELLGLTHLLSLFEDCGRYNIRMP
jgi:anti-anti-sigma factor